MLKPERVTFSADDDKFNQFTNSDQLNTFFNDSLVHYSTDFKKTDQQELSSIKHSNSLDELSSITMSSQQQQQPQHEPPASAPPSLISEQIPILNENNLHQLDALTLQQLATGSNQTLSNIDEENNKTSPSHSTSLADIQKEIDRVKQMKYGRKYSSPTSSLCSRITTNPFNGSNNNIDLSSITHSVHFNEQSSQPNRLPFSSTYITSIPESIVPASNSSSTNDNHFIPIHSIESPSLEDREVFETFHTKQTSIPGIAIRQSIDSLNRNISSSETELIASLHRSASKQALDSQSDHGTTYSGTSDDLIFIEWDKERSLFQDYINSLRTEIRVLLQERLEYQKQMEAINNNLNEHQRVNSTQINTDQTKFNLLQKSLEEKNLVLEQLQKEYETVKEKNSNLTRKISNLRCDAKSQTGVIDELKQKIAELTVDIQNHILVKRRLEISMMNLESDCKMIDADRIRLNNDIKDTQLSKQDLEKLLQKANVQIAEQGSTIEMLRSDNIQIRSQLSATQRRMLQEKQQVMDYLRQIENDLVEKEQIKQRESILRKDFEKLQSVHKQDRQEIEQLNLQINQDQQKLTQLEQERLQLLKTIQNQDDKQTQVESELDSYKSATKRLSTHFKMPFDSIQSLDQLIPMLEDRYRTEQVSHARVHDIPLVQSTPELNKGQETEEIRQLREDLALMNIQLKQLDEANQAWQQYQQNQLVLLRDRLNLTDMNNLSFEDMVQQIENRFNDLNNQLTELQNVKKTDLDTIEIQNIDTQPMTDNIRQTKDTQTEDNEEYPRQEEDKSQEIPIQNVAFDAKQYEDELHQLREDLTALTTQCAQLDEANRAWQQYHQTQLDSFKNKLQNSLPIENKVSLDDIAQQIVNHLDQVQNDRANLIQQLQTSEKLNNDFRSESTSDKQAIQQTYLNTIDELNQQLRLLKQQNDQLETEKYILNQQIENQASIPINQERNTPTPDSISSDSKLVKKHTHPAQIHEAQIHNVTPVQSASPLINEHEQELQPLRESVALLTNQCAQLNEANRAWQQYQQTQLDSFREKIQDYLPMEENSSLEQAAQYIVDQITRERQDYTAQYQALERANNDLRSESATHLDTINELNQELFAMKEKSEQTNDLTSSHLLSQTVDEVPRTGSESNDQEEVRQLRENLVSLTAELDATNRTWEQYRQRQIDILRHQLQNSLSIDYNTSFDDIIQQVVDQITREREDFSKKCTALEKANNDLQTESSNNMESIRESYINAVNELNQELLLMKEAYDQIDAEKQDLIHELEKRPIEVDQEQARQSIEKVSSNIWKQPFKEVPIHSSGVNVEQEGEEVQHLRDSVVLLTNQCAQLDEANRAWQQYQQTQLDNFREKIQDYLPMEDNSSLEQAAQYIVDQITRERQDYTAQYQALERANNNLRSESAIHLESMKESYLNIIDELNRELLAIKEKNEQTNNLTSSHFLSQTVDEVPRTDTGSNDQEEVRQLRENVVSLTAELDATNQTWEQQQQRQLDILRNQLQNSLSIDYNTSFDDIIQQVVDQITRERENFSERYTTLEKANNDLRSESSNNLESIRQSYINAVNELNQELLAMKEAYDQVDAEKQDLINELEKRPVAVDQEQVRQSIEKVSSDIWKQPFKEVPIHSSGGDVEQEGKEVQQLRDSVALLTNQCAQLDEANRAWQQYQQTQLHNFQTKLHDYLPVDENTSFDEIAQQLVDQITKEREDFTERHQALERAKDNLQSESSNNMESIRQSYTNTINELSQELLTMKEAYEQLDTEKQVLISELEKRPVQIDQEHARQTIEKVPSDLFKQPFAEVPIHTSGTNVERDAEELRQLRENVAFLTNQCAQLNEANRAWQQYQQTQLDNFREKIQDYLPIDENLSLEQAAQQIVDQIMQEREDFNARFHAVEKNNDDLRLESTSHLELVKESYMNTMDELNRELLTMKEAYAQLDTEKQVLITELEKRPVQTDPEHVKQTIEKVPSNTLKQPFEEVPIHTSGANAEQHIEELQQLRDNVALLTTQCAQLEGANRAWQLFQQTQLDNFRTKFLDCLPIDETLTLDQTAQQIVDQIFKEREDFTERYQALEKVNSDLRSESAIDLETIKQSYSNAVNELNQELLAMKEAYEQADAEKQFLISELDKRPVDLDREQGTESSPINLSHEIPLHTSGANVEQENEELRQLRENLALLTSQYTQLNEANQAWEEFHQSQLNNFRRKVQDYLQIDEDFSFDQIAQQVVDQITKEREDFSEHYQQVLHEKQILINQIENRPVINNQEQDTQTIESTNSNLLEQETEMSQLRANLTLQLDQANRSWQLFYNNQIDLLKTQLNDSQEKEQFLNQQILTLENECQTLEQQLKDHQYSIDSFKNNFELISNENEQLKQQFNELQETNDLLMNNNQNLKYQLERPSSPFVSQENFKQIRRTPTQEVQIHTVTPVQSASSPNLSGEEAAAIELQQLRAHFSTLTAQCAQLDEANRAWQQYHQNQLGIFRNKLQDWILLDENSTLDQIAQQIVIQLDHKQNDNQLDSSTAIESLNKQLINYQLNESILAQNYEELNQKLLGAYQECEEIREDNAQLVLSKQQIEQQLEEQQRQTNDLQSNSEELFHLQQQNNSLNLENQQLQFKLNDMEQRLNQFAVQRVESPRENVAIHDIDREDQIRQLRTDLAAASTHCLQLEEANRAWQKYQHDQIESFRQQLQEQIPSFNQIENPSLDFIAQQIINHLHQLNIQRDSLIRQSELLKDEMQLQKQQMERPASADGGKRMFRRLSQDKQIREAQIHNVTPVQSASPLINEHEQELQQLRESVALLTNQCAQLNEANRAWLQYQQTQLDNFREKIQDYLPMEENSSLEHAAQQIVDQITRERQDYTAQYQALERTNHDLRSESATHLDTINELNQELFAMKEKSEQTNDLTSSHLLSQTVDEVPRTDTESNDQEEVRQLRENVVSLTAELDATNRIWEQQQQRQLDTLRNQLQNCLWIDHDTSFDDIVQQVVDQITKEREDFSERYTALEKANNDLQTESSNNLESIRQSYINAVNELNQELLAMKDAYEQVDAEKQDLINELEKRPIEVDQEQARQSIEKVSSNIWKQPFKEVPIHSSGADVEQEGEEVQQLRDSVALLTNQCAQLDEANRAWQQYQQTQLHNFQTKLHDYLPVDENTSFDEIAQQLVDQITKEREDFTERHQALERANNDLQPSDNIESIRESHINTVDELNRQLLAMKEAYEQLDTEKQVLISELEKRPVEVDQEQARQSVEKIPSSIWRQPFKEVPIHTSGVDSEQNLEELQQLRENVVVLTAQCAYLDEANRAWQQYQQTQLDNFKTKLVDYLPVDEGTSFDEIAQQIIGQLIKEREDFSERYTELEKVNADLQSESAIHEGSTEESSPENLEELHQEFLNLKDQYEELEKINKQLLIEKEEVNSRLNDRSIVVGHHSAFESNLIEDETPIELQHESELESSSTPTETDEIHQIRSDLASITSEFTELTQTHETELNSFRNKLQNWISLSPNSTLDEIAEQLNTQFEQQNPPETTENQTQTTAPSEKVHIAIGTIPLTYENHQTQIDPINMIDQQIQTESFQQLWSTSDDETLFNTDEDDDRFKDYIEEITSLSPIDLSNRLNKECQQILSKQKFEKTSYPNLNLDLNHLALITIYSLYNQHLKDDGTDLYNQTVIRALKEEYELINKEKTDYMEKYFTEIDLREKKLNKLQIDYDDLLEQNELERLDAKQSLKDLTQKYEFNLSNLHQENEQLKYNFNHLEENSQQTKTQNYEQLENEYQQLKQDYDEIINQNELLKDYNSQMYQQKLQDSDDDDDENKSSHDMEIQCNLSEEVQLSDWDDDNTNRDLPIQEQGSEKSSNEEEINRLNAIISEIQRENENLKETNLQNENLHSTTDRPILIDSYVQTENEQTSSLETEDNDWNSQISPLEIPSDEQNSSSMIKQTLDNETQTDDQAQDKLAQVNNKLKRALQTIKEKIHQAVIDRPELFPDINDDTIERLEHLISAIENQAIQIEILHNDRDNLLKRNQQLEKQRISDDNSTQTDFDQEEQTTKINDEEEPSLTNRLFGFISNVTSPSRTNETIDNETQTEEQSQDKLTQVNHKLKRALQTIKEKIHQAVIDRPELFPDTNDDTIERLEHLISAIGNQAIQINILQNERDHAQQEINQLQSSLEACQYQIENERPIKTEQLVSAAPVSDDISPSMIEDYEKQIGQLQQALSQNEDERTLLRQRLNEVELEFRKTLDDHSSTSAMYEEQFQSLAQERNTLVEQQVLQSVETQREIEQLQEELAQFKRTPVTSTDDIKSLQEVIQQQSDELRDLSEKYFDLSSQIDAHDKFDQQKRDTEERLNNYENQIEQLIRENANLLDELQKKDSSPVQTIDNESQTDDQQHDKLAQMNNKLKRALQTLKEKIHRIVVERPDLFVNIGEETNERLDSLISTVEHQATQLDILQTERNQSEEQLRNEVQELQSSLEACQHDLDNERSMKAEQLVSTAPTSDDISQSTIENYEQQIKQLHQKLSQHEDERTLLRERLNEVELEFRKTLDDHSSTSAMYEEQFQSLVQERNALVEQQVLQLAENQREIEQLQQELADLKQSVVNQPADTSSNEEIQSLREEIEQKAEELKDLNEKYVVLSSQFDSNVNSQSEFDRQRQEIEARLIDYKNQIENLTQERANLLEEIRKGASSSISMTDNDKQTTDQQNDKLVKISNKLKRVLQTFKEKIHRVVTERPDLFVDIGEETTERLDRLISTVEHQATQIDILQAEREQSEEQLRNEIRELQGSVDAYRYQIENERPIKTEQLVSAAPPPDDLSPSIIGDYEKQIGQLQQKLSQNEDERTLLRERLNEVELEFRKTLDDHSSTSAMYEEQFQSLAQERNALVEQQALQSAKSEHEIEQLQSELAQLKQSDQDIESLKDIIGQQSEQLKHLNEKYNAVSSQLESQAELDQQRKELEARLTDYENQIENLTRERANLLEEIRKNASSSVPITESEKHADDQQNDKLVKMNTKLKRFLQTFKEKIHRLVTERPDLFANIGEETSERLDHLISTVERQAAQMDTLQTERNEIEQQLRSEINELQNSFEFYRQQMDNENRMQSPTALVHKIETETTEHKREIQPSQTSNDNQWNNWSIDSSTIPNESVQHSTDQAEPSVANRLFGFLKNVTSPWSEETPTNDWNDQSSPLQLPSEEPQQTMSSPSLTDNLTQIIKDKIQQIVSEYPDLFPDVNEDVLNNLDQFTSIIKHLQNQINQLQSRLTDYQNPKDIEIQTANEPSTPSEQRISRRVFEQEILAWSKESDQLKQFVKQIQIENKKLKDIVLKLERMIHDYVHENERLKQENQQFSLLSYPLNTEDNSRSSDIDICYLTLKWLTYEVAQRTSDDHNEQSSFIIDDNEPYLKQRLIDTERQLKSIRIQNQKLKKQLETYTIQLKHIQHEMNIKTQELSTLKTETDRLRASETQYRLEVDRLKADLQCDQVKFQHLERELTDLNFERTNIDNSSTNNLHELLELKERELNALKEKLEYTLQAHQLELQEAIKANQFSLDNVQRFEQLDQRHQEKRKELETRLGKICKIVRPLIDSQYLFSEDPMIDMDELQQLITDTETEERVINSLGPIRDCLGLLESQMKELQDNLIESHARRSKRSKYRSGFESLSLENQWEITPNSNLFLEPMSTDFIANDVRLCLDDILDEVIVRTTVK